VLGQTEEVHQVFQVAQGFPILAGAPDKQEEHASIQVVGRRRNDALGKEGPGSYGCEEKTPP